MPNVAIRFVRSPLLGGLWGVVTVLWQGFWLVGPPIGVALGVGSPERHEYLVWGFISLLLATIQGVWALLYRESELKKQITALTMRLTPKLNIVAPIIQPTPIADGFGNTTGDAIYIQLPVACSSDVPVHGCSGQLVSVFKWRENAWESTVLNEATLLYWSNTYTHPPESVTIYPGVPRNLNVLRVLSTNQEIEPQFYGIPTRMKGLFNSFDKFRFDVAVSTSDGNTIKRSITFKLGDKWNVPEICQ